MKISTNNTAIGLLETCNPHSFSILKESPDMTQAYATTLGINVVEQWPKVVSLVKNKVRLLSTPFYNAYEKALPKLLPILDIEPMDEDGVFVFRSGSKETNTIFYAIHTEGKGDNWRIAGFVFIFNNRDGDKKPSLAMYAQRNTAGIKTYIAQKGREAGCTNSSIFADIYSMLLFIRFCEVDTKIVKANKKETHVGTKYINETKSSIEILDSTWFTTIIRSEGFSVGKDTGGFFRLQPCGRDRSDRKLIWVMPFEKHGYTRKAKILAEHHL